MPRGFNDVPDHYVIGKHCYWRNGRPVEPDYWPTFKQFERVEPMLRYRYVQDKPIAFSTSLIIKAFNPVYDISGRMIRDSIFSFLSWVENTFNNGEHVMFKVNMFYNIEMDSYIIDRTDTVEER